MRLSEDARREVAWQERALCRRESAPDVFFPETTPRAGIKERCNTECEVREQCLAYALAHDVVGIWGGTSTKERRRMKKTLVAC